MGYVYCPFTQPDNHQKLANSILLVYETFFFSFAGPEIIPSHNCNGSATVH